MKMRWERWAVFLVCIAASAVGGCGLIHQGTTQTVRLGTQPDGASISFAGHDAVSPGTLVLSRRVRTKLVFRAAKPGYHPACQVINCGFPRWLVTLDSIPAALPLLIDLAAGSLGSCDDTTLTLDPVRPDDVAFTLPDDREILANEDEPVCRFPYIYDKQFSTQAERILVSAGGIDRPYELLGNVDFGKLGFDETRGGAVAIRGISFGRATHTFSKAAPAEINALLRVQALHQFGNRVDALINVNYQSDPANDVFATAVAVHFTNQEPRTEVSASTRLNELEKLRKSGLIDPREYEQKRAEILRGL